MCGRIKEMQSVPYVVGNLWKFREGPQNLFLFMTATQSRGVALHK